MDIVIDFGNIWDMLSAIGTVGAVVFSLWIVKKDERRKLKLSVNGIDQSMMVFHSSFEKTYIETVSFECFNYSKFPIVVSSIGVIVYEKPVVKFLNYKFIKKYLKKEVYFLKPDLSIRDHSSLPRKINEMESEHILMRLEYFKESLEEVLMDINENQSLYIDFYVKDNFRKLYSQYIEIKFGDIGKNKKNQ